MESTISRAVRFEASIRSDLSAIIWHLLKPTRVGPVDHEMGTPDGLDQISLVSRKSSVGVFVTRIGEFSETIFCMVTSVAFNCRKLDLIELK